MTWKLLIAPLFFLLAVDTNAQQFITKGIIEYEVKANIKKTMADNSWQEMMKDNMSQFKTSYYNLTFAENKSIFKFDRWDPSTKIPIYLKKNDEENIWYSDYDTDKSFIQKSVVGSIFSIEDSLRKISWKLSDERKLIAGYNCRKATGIIMDSIYVFAFYTDEIPLSGGPCSINGLPGVILGLTIPRLYESWVATKVSTENVNLNIIKPVLAKKYITNKALNILLQERMKDWYSDDDESDNQQKAQFFWNAFL